MTQGPIRIGEVVDKYELVRLLGEGSFGQVYEARHRVIGHQVVLKFLRPEVARLPEVLSRFYNEARAAGRIKHENIIGIHDIGVTAASEHYIVMEYCEGLDCETLLEHQKRLPAARAIGIARQVCSGLRATHARNIVHRDLKPANLFLTVRSDGSELVKILDFGVAKLHAGSALDVRTKDGARIGTPLYMSPEQANGEPDVDHRTDIYALGVILYELLSGRTPFHDAPSTAVLLYQITSVPPPPLTRFVTEVPRELSAIMDRALAKRREDRFHDAAELSAALAACAEGIRNAPRIADALGDVSPIAGRPVVARAAGRPIGSDVSPQLIAHEQPAPAAAPIRQVAQALAVTPTEQPIAQTPTPAAPAIATSVARVVVVSPEPDEDPNASGTFPIPSAIAKDAAASGVHENDAPQTTMQPPLPAAEPAPTAAEANADDVGTNKARPWSRAAPKNLLYICMLVVGAPAIGFAIGSAPFLELLCNVGRASSCYDLAEFYSSNPEKDADGAKRRMWLQAAARDGHAPANTRLGLMFEHGDGVDRDPITAVKFYHAAARNHDVEGQYNLARMYEQGEGVAADANAAKHWYGLAAENEHLGAQLQLARMLDRGDGIAADHALALRWFERAAAAGDVDAQYEVGRRYDVGDGVARDPAVAFKWYKAVADSSVAPEQLRQGSRAVQVQASFQLGEMYRDGRGVKKDLTAAAARYKHAARKGHAGAEYALGKLYYAGDGVPADRAEAGKLIAAAASAGLAAAQTQLAKFYVAGDGVPVDYGLARSWYRMAAAQGDVLAEFGLGELSELGVGGPVDAKVAREWYGKAARHGHRDAMVRLAALHTGAKEYAPALKWYQAAADLNDRRAQTALGEAYEMGRGVEVDPRAAIQWYERAAENGDATAQFRLAFIYDQGKLVPADAKAALRWYKAAAIQGSSSAKNNIGVLYDTGRIEGGPSEAFKWYKEASNLGNTAAADNLGSLYETGRGVAADKVLAAASYRRAAEGGDDSGQYNLGRALEYGIGVVLDKAAAGVWYRKAAAQGFAPAEQALKRLDREAALPASRKPAWISEMDRLLYGPQGR